MTKTFAQFRKWRAIIKSAIMLVKDPLKILIYITPQITASARARADVYSPIDKYSSICIWKRIAGGGVLIEIYLMEKSV